MNSGKTGFAIEKDEISGKAYDSRMMRRLILYLKPYTWQVIVAVVLLLLISVTRLAGPYLIKIAIDQYILQGDTAGLLFILLVFIRILIK